VSNTEMNFQLRAEEWGKAVYIKRLSQAKTS
jgi:hypothetical protein